MKKPESIRPEVPPDLSEDVSPEELVDAAHRFINAKKPPGGWNRGPKKKPRENQEG